MSNVKTPEFPLVAEFGDLADCLRQMGQRPLKLVANKAQKRLKESEWNSPKWSFVEDNGVIKDKKLLSNTDDTFQFSIAGRKSRQDFHVHRKIFEIYLSNSKMEISYKKRQMTETMGVSRGVLIVPPGVAHKITLHGFAFVFQASIKGSKVHGDKKSISS